ncbi:MAG: hypothetical protein HC831_08055 [Chloroflexia bacterium]|nr:hypothetical protein [Chloroflexia bacterium]
MHQRLPILCQISELYFREAGQLVDIASFCHSDLGKAELLRSHNAFFADFGTRRRYNFQNQERVVQIFNYNRFLNFVGTSNVYVVNSLENMLDVSIKLYENAKIEYFIQKNFYI